MALNTCCRHDSRSVHTVMSSHLLGSRSRHVDTRPLTSVMTWDGGTRDVCSSQDPYPHRTRCPPSRIRPNPAQTGPATTPRAACKHTPAYRFALEAARCSSECASILATPQTAGRAAVAARGTGPPPAPDPTSHRRKPGATGHISSTATAPGGGGGGLGAIAHATPTATRATPPHTSVSAIQPFNAHCMPRSITRCTSVALGASCADAPCRPRPTRPHAHTHLTSQAHKVRQVRHAHRRMNPRSRTSLPSTLCRSENAS